MRISVDASALPKRHNAVVESVSGKRIIGLWIQQHRIGRKWGTILVRGLESGEKLLSDR